MISEELDQIMFDFMLLCNNFLPLPKKALSTMSVRHTLLVRNLKDCGSTSREHLFGSKEIQLISH